MKKLILFFAIIAAQCSYASVCLPKQFCELASKIADSSYLVVKCVIVSNSDTGATVRVLEVLKGNINPGDTFHIVNSLSHSIPGDKEYPGLTTVQTSLLGKNTDTLILITKRIFTNQYSWDKPGTYRMPGDTSMYFNKCDQAYIPVKSGSVSINVYPECLICEKTYTYISFKNFLLENCNPNLLVITSVNEEVDYQSIRLFPNPTSNDIQVIGLAGHTVASVNVSTLAGIQLRNPGISKVNIINLSDLPSGTYLLTLSFSGDKKIVRKVTIH